MNATPLRSVVTVTDQFCGAGGSSIGVVQSGAELRMALNHWRLAIETHNTNFPQADHDCTDISACDPRRYPSTDVLITSPECTNHSLAKGVERLRQAGLFDTQGPNPAAERSRATMWDVPRFAEYHRYKVIVVENVVDARHWLLFDAWLHAMNLLGYDNKALYLNSMHFGVPQSRDRMYIVFWLRGNRAPDLDFRPPAFCDRCATTVAAVQSWKKNGVPWGRYGRSGQYAYRCPTCAAEMRPQTSPAWTALDWQIPAPRIGDRKRPLRPNTRRRIAAGLQKFRHEPLLVPTDHTHANNNSVYPVSGQLPTQTTRQVIGMVVPPFVVGFYSPGWQRPVTDPLGTITAIDRHALIIPEDAIAVDDCGFRMLVPRELQAGMAFPPDYILLGNSRNQTRLLGNAVTPPVMSWIFAKVMESLS